MLPLGDMRLIGHVESDHPSRRAGQQLSEGTVSQGHHHLGRLAHLPHRVNAIQGRVAVGGGSRGIWCSSSMAITICSLALQVSVGALQQGLASGMVIRHGVCKADAVRCYQCGQRDCAARLQQGAEGWGSPSEPGATAECGRRRGCLGYSAVGQIASSGRASCCALPCRG